MKRPRGILIACTLLVAACAPQAEPIFGTPSGARTIVLQVANRSFEDATIYAVRHNERRRAGIVGAKSNANLNVRWTSSAPLRVEVRRLANETCVTREIEARPGDVVSVEIALELGAEPQCQIF